MKNIIDVLIVIMYVNLLMMNTNEKNNKLVFTALVAVGIFILAVMLYIILVVRNMSLQLHIYIGMLSDSLHANIY